MIPVVTIDGPTCSGKGTIAKLLAHKLGWRILDSGILYRILALVAIQNSVDLANENLLTDLAENLSLKFVFVDGDCKVFLKNQDISNAIRHEQCSVAASRVSAFPKVRAALLKMQRNFVSRPGLVADGRDMGTVVFPDALLKVFLTADPKERAERRYKQLQEQQINVSLDDVYRELLERDKRDMERSVSPLKPASDAVIIDTSKKSVDEVVSFIMDLINKKL
jgi:CMP/dCMP kinase